MKSKDRCLEKLTAKCLGLKSSHIFNQNENKYFAQIARFEDRLVSYTKFPAESQSNFPSKVMAKSIPNHRSEETSRVAEISPPKTHRKNIKKTPLKASSNNRNVDKPNTVQISPVERTYPQLKKVRLRTSLKPPAAPRLPSNRVMWTTEQEEEFYIAVQRLGFGNWAKIRDYIDCNKSSVGLKDKWRHFHRSGRINELIAKFGNFSK